MGKIGKLSLRTHRLFSVSAWQTSKKFRTLQYSLHVRLRNSYHIQPILQSLHWPPVTHCIQCKISAICFKSLSGKSLQHLSDFVQPDTPNTQTITLCIWHPYLRHPSCKHKTIRRKTILLYRPICLEQWASVSPSLGFFYIIEYRS